VGDVLQMRGVGVRRGASWILREIRWSVASDEHWVLLGPNGAGKSTLLDIAGTRIHPTIGEVEVLGEIIGLSDVFELRPRLGLVGSHVSESIRPREQVRDVVLTAAYGMTGRWREAYDPADERRADRLLALLGVADLANRPFASLSDGERGRVQIARALMADPELLLLDEPAAGLDLGGREALVQRLARMAADPLAPTTILVTHHVEEIPPGTTHALVLREGLIVGQGRVEEVLTDAVLSAAYGIPLRVERRGSRWMAQAIE